MSTNLKPLLARLASGETLSEAEAEAAFGIIMSGEATPAQIAGLLMAMRVRGETVAELVGAVRAMRARMASVAAPPGAIDVCGTGGDNAGTLNVSTAVTFVLAGAGVPVAKHGNRALSSRTGGADVLAALGVEVDVPLARLPAVLLAGPLRVPVRAAPPRRPAPRRRPAGRARHPHDLQPARAAREPGRGCKRQLIGVFDPAWAQPMAETLAALGTERAWIVHGEGLDELTVAGENRVVELNEGRVRTFTLLPEEAGLPRAPVAAIGGGDAEANAAALRALLGGAAGPYRDTVLLNAAAALIVAGPRGRSARGRLACRACDRERCGAGGAGCVTTRDRRRRALTARGRNGHHPASPQERCIRERRIRHAVAHLRREARGGRPPPR